MLHKLELPTHILPPWLLLFKMEREKHNCKYKHKYSWTSKYKYKCKNRVKIQVWAWFSIIRSFDTYSPRLLYKMKLWRKRKKGKRKIESTIKYPIMHWLSFHRSRIRLHNYENQIDIQVVGVFLPDHAMLKLQKRKVEHILKWVLNIQQPGQLLSSWEHNKTQNSRRFSLFNKEILI